ncbi:MAG: hypothetical protein NZL91_10235, partial [Thermoflexales bacterium]|nr:hypothetical protein [Thermoflexales bacterium]
QTEQRLQELTKQVGALSNLLGATLEAEAASVIEVVLRRKGYQPLGSPFPLTFDGELDVLLPAKDVAGRVIWVVVEAKARLSKSDVRAWADRMRSAGWQKRMAARGYPGPFLAYFYALRADLGARELIQAEGLGLLGSEGEIIAPEQLIEPLAS